MVKTKSRPSADALGGSVTHLLHRALQLALDYHSEAAGPGAITQRQYTVLAAAAAQDGLTQNDLVRSTGIDSSTLANGGSVSLQHIGKRLELLYPQSHELKVVITTEQFIIDLRIDLHRAIN